MQKNDFFEDNKVIVGEVNADCWTLIAHNEDLLVVIKPFENQPSLLYRVLDGVDTFAEVDGSEFFNRIDGFIQRSELAVFGPYYRSFAVGCVYRLLSI